MPQAAALRPERTASRLRALLAWALPVLVFAAALAAFGIRYDTNDDAIIADIAAGAYGPDRIHLVYVNLLFGCLLRPLYALAAGVNWYVVVQLALLPLVVGITYEFNRYVGGHDNPVTNFLAKPGLWMQNFTTFEPDDSMIEVGIRALELVLPEKQGEDAW